MTSFKHLLLICLFVAVIHTQSYGGVFAFSWLAGFCDYEAINKRQNCEARSISLWDQQSFTIHGIWPDQVSSTTFGAFNVALFQNNVKLLDDMHNYWPPKSKASSTNVFLWQHQWEAHGKDLAAILFKLKPEAFPGTTDQRNNALQLAFYNDVINFYKKLHVQKLAAGTYTRAALAHQLGIAQNQFAFVCSRQNILRQLQVCLDITKAGIVLKACNKGTNCSGGGQTVQLLSWKAKGQSRVTNY